MRNQVATLAAPVLYGITIALFANVATAMPIADAAAVQVL